MDEERDISLELVEETAAIAARAAGKILMDHWITERRVDFKGEIDLVTDADRASEEEIAAIIRARFPGHQILAEEGAVGASSSSFRWIVDPLDGTTNYAHGFPHFSVSIAFEARGELRVGTVYDPVRDELFTGRSGSGAYLNGSRLSVSKVTQLGKALLASGFPYDRRNFDPVLKRWGYFAKRCQALRRSGSAALDICYVAAGRFDAFWEDELHPWDSAAGVVLVREAGGRVTGFGGGPVDIVRGEILASNPFLHAPMIDGLAAADGNAPGATGSRSRLRRRRLGS